MADITDKEIVDYLVELIAAHEGGSTVMLGFDDATFSYTISVGRNNKLLGASRGFRRMVQLAKSGERFDD